MDAHRQDTIRAALGALLAAVATVGTLALAVIAPMHGTPNDPKAGLPTASNRIEVVIVPARVEVIGVRNAKSA